MSNYRPPPKYDPNLPNPLLNDSFPVIFPKVGLYDFFAMSDNLLALNEQLNCEQEFTSNHHQWQKEGMLV